jgi:hypothetical protein
MSEINFKDLIEAPIDYLVEKPGVSATRSYEGAKKVFFKSLIFRTVRLTLQYPELAKEYIESFPKAVSEENIPTASEK